MTLIPVLLALVFRNPLFLGISAAILVMMLVTGNLKLGETNIFKRKISTSDFIIERGVLVFGNKYIAFVVVDDIPYDYRDLSESSLKSSINAFHKVTNIGSQIDIIFRKKIC
ncbi:hypothetical protein [Metallosphaera hakonensis]|uniref:hypothetical protein n=1 Tax=Metallosphaera hakonensis TaxID=79601 RepID=UPI0020935C38|nr:hypothetical protein [Metallosphaera hakonensis]